jgi:hypothetical protein
MPLFQYAATERYRGSMNCLTFPTGDAAGSMALKSHPESLVRVGFVTGHTHHPDILEPIC